MLGFAKLRGFSPWPAQTIGQAEAGGKTWVRFFGKNQLGTIPRKNWTDLTSESHKTIGLKNAKKVTYRIALDLMMVESNKNHATVNAQEGCNSVSEHAE